jgi:signal transduction histidine kinase/CheY-like chemotaxis protein
MSNLKNTFDTSGKTLTMILSTPLGLVVLVGATISGVELFIMLVAHDIFVPAIFSESIWGYVDTTILTLTLAPVLYFLVFRQMQKNMMRAQTLQDEAERANQAKSHFLSSISHELRTPLNAILGFGQLLKFEIDSSTLSQQESISHILLAGHHLSGLIEQMLDLARIDIGKWEINSESLSIAGLISSCADQVAVAMEDNLNITIENTITDTSLWVQGDDLSLRQVLINLLSNAVKYNKQDGRVTISSVIEKAGRLRIEVRDTGAGIPCDKLPLLFTPFERIDQKYGTISGVGIGLHISKRLIEMMQGTIGVESVPGKGSTFWFDLPLAQKADEPTMASTEIEKPMLHKDSRFNILYIEDNASNVKLVERALRRFPGIKLFVAGTATAGLSIAEQEHPDLILMDIHLPDMDGITATTLLKRNDAIKHIPVMALSADAMQGDINRALNAGCCAYLTKPIELQMLYEKIASVGESKE